MKFYKYKDLIIYWNIFYFHFKPGELARHGRTLRIGGLSLVLFQGGVGVDVRLLSWLPSSLASLLHVGLDVEIGEEKEEQGSVEQDDVAEYLGEITLHEERETGVNEESDELSEL